MRAHASLAVWTLLAASRVLASTTPTPTATPAARLSGGFGRPRATPVATAPTKGQSLNDVVRAASETRQGAAEAPKSGGVSINNRNLVTDPNRGRLTTWQATPRPAGRVAPTGVPGKATIAADAPTPTPSPDPAEGEEAKWREIASRSRQRVADLKDRVARLDTETKKLETDFYAWDDGQYRDNVIKPAWDKKREELETARRDLEEAERDLAELPDRARKAGALPGWIRE